MRGEVIQGADELLGFVPGTTDIVSIEGGFTGAKKYILRGNETSGTASEVFAKVVDLTTNPEEAIVLDTEAAMYGIISELDGVNQYFPAYRGYKKDSKHAALFIDYLPNLSWGGPWTTETVELLAKALHDVHETNVPQGAGEKITELAELLRTKLYEQSPYTFNRQIRRQLFEKAVNFTNGVFTNSRGEEYYHLPASLAIELADAASQFNPDAERKFLVTDLNFGNIGFSPSQAYFVDPVYIELGVAQTDMVNAGMNILRTLPDTEENTALIEHVKNEFVSDKTALADAITYWVACTTLDYRGEEDAWMDFQQECTIAALRVWESKYKSV